MGNTLDFPRSPCPPPPCRSLFCDASLPCFLSQPGRGVRQSDAGSDLHTNPGMDMTDVERRACAPPAPWISRDIYAELEITTQDQRIRLEVRAFRLNPAAEASLVYCAFRLEDGIWRELRGENIPVDAAEEGSRLVALARGVDLTKAQYGVGATIDRTGEVPQRIIDLGTEQQDELGLACDRCGHSVPEGKHLGHGFEILCECCYGGRYDAHAAGVAAVMLEEIADAVRAGERIDHSSAEDEQARSWAAEELRDLHERFGKDYAAAVQEEAERRVMRRLGQTDA
jgi:hypothetical protein